MKRVFIILIAVAATCGMHINAWNIKDALGGLTKDGSSAQSGLGAALGNLLSTDKIEISQLEGVWQYAAPAVAFKTDDILKKAGGAAASSVIVSKLEPLYARTGFNKSVLTVKSDSTFTFKAGKITLSGTISTVAPDAGSQANFVFNFSVGGMINVGKVDTYVTKNVTGAMDITFDVSKLISIMETVGSISGNATLKSTVELLKSYDGLCAGFEMKRTSDAPAS